MNENNITGRVYAQKVELLLRLMPIVMEEGVFAVHGGTAINLFLKDLPRYSVDIDLTYIPLADRKQSLEDINLHLAFICEKEEGIQGYAHQAQLRHLQVVVRVAWKASQGGG